MTSTGWLGADAAWLALVLGAAFGLVARPLATRATPRLATWLLSAGALASAAAALLVLAMLAAPMVGQADGIADSFHLSGKVLRRDSPLSRSLAVLSILVLFLLLTRASVVFARRVGELRRAARASRAIGDAAGPLVVLPTTAVDAYALPGRPGRVVVTRGLLAMLSAAERRAVIEHERAHLRHRHHLHVSAGLVAAATNPLLSGIPRAIDYATERWADEVAASHCDRSTVREALLRVGAQSSSAKAQAPEGLAALPLTGDDVGARARALDAKPPRPRALLVGVAAVLVLGTMTTAGLAADHTYEIFQLAAAADQHVVHEVHKVIRAGASPGSTHHVSRLPA